MPKTVVELAKERFDNARAELDAARKGLDAAYSHARHNKYPNGMFILERDEDHGYARKSDKGKKLFTLHWCPDLGWRSGFGFTNRRQQVRKDSDWVWLNDPVNPSTYRPQKRGRGGWGNKVTTYDSLAKLIMAADKYNVPQEVIDAFVKKCFEEGKQ